jgi:FdrA protein
MVLGYVVRRNKYYDSVFLMGVNKRLSESDGVLQTVVLMGSDANKGLLQKIGFQGDEIDTAKPNDLIVGVIAESDEIVRSILDNLDQYLTMPELRIGAKRVRSIDDALGAKPGANLAVLSIPGEYVFREAVKVLETGMHTFIFSSNVPVEEELELKRLSLEKGLLVMGPDCGTSIVGGKGIGFANAVRQGSIGAIGPSGTGLQEFTTLIHHAGEGISHAVGTGSRDLSSEIGGITTLLALDAIEEDPQTEVIAIISKPPEGEVLDVLLRRIKTCTKPVIGCFLGIEGLTSDEFHLARTIDEAVELAVKLANGQDRAPLEFGEDDLSELVHEFTRTLSPRQEYIRGLFAGGTFCYQSQQILCDAGFKIFSNAPIDRSIKLVHHEESRGHTLIDMGDEEYTLGRPHPMIDSTLRAHRILSEGQDPHVAVLLLDIVLGYNASPDPVGDLLDSIIEVKNARKEKEEELIVVASICGTEDDPQDLNLQRERLERAGVIVFSSNGKAASFCRELIAQHRGGSDDTDN